MTQELISQTAVAPTEDTLRRRRFPPGAALTFQDTQDAGREGVLDQLRAEGPVSWVPSLGGWLLTSRAAAKGALSPRSDMSVQVHENQGLVFVGPHEANDRRTGAYPAAKAV
jgi:hypothetical protein